MCCRLQGSPNTIVCFTTGRWRCRQCKTFYLAAEETADVSAAADAAVAAAAVAAAAAAAVAVVVF